MIVKMILFRQNDTVLNIIFGRKFIFFWIFDFLDYLECYVNGLPAVAKASFKARFGIESTRTKVTAEIIAHSKQLFSEGKTIAQVAQETGISTASCQKIKKGDYDN